MDPATIGYIACAIVLLLLAIRIPIAYAIGGVAVVAIFIVFATRTGTAPLIELLYMSSRLRLRSLPISSGRLPTCPCASSEAGGAQMGW